MTRRIGSILHGAYGDYYWQATCLKHFVERNPGTKLFLFSAAPVRRQVLQKFDFSFAECFLPWEEIPATPVDEFLQYQVFDAELRQDVLAHLRDDVLAKIDRKHNRIFWRDLRGVLPLASSQRLQLNDEGRREVRLAMEQYGIPEDLFSTRKTIAFVWRQRAPGSLYLTLGQPRWEVLVAKYSRVLRRLINDFDCHVLITGMNLVTDGNNRYRVDAKYATFALDLPPERCTYLKGRNWVADLEILSRCSAALVRPAGFSEALDTHRGGGAILVDPSYYYPLILLKYRVALFNYMTPRGFFRVWWRPHTEQRIYRWVAEGLRRTDK